jgi:hypothetical protein
MYMRERRDFHLPSVTQLQKTWVYRLVVWFLLGGFLVLLPSALGAQCCGLGGRGRRGGGGVGAGARVGPRGCNAARFSVALISNTKKKAHDNNKRIISFRMEATSTKTHDNG